VVGLSSDANIMFNKRINWKMKMNQKSMAYHAAKRQSFMSFLKGDACVFDLSLSDANFREGGLYPVA
jgi:hypothetical protein